MLNKKLNHGSKVDEGLLNLWVSLLLDSQEEERRLRFLLDGSEFGRGNLAMIRIIRWCCLLRLLAILVKTLTVIAAFQNGILFTDWTIQRPNPIERLDWVLFKVELNEVFKSNWLFSKRIVKGTEVWTVIFLGL